jgi:hypothetical protein
LCTAWGGCRATVTWAGENPRKTPQNFFIALIFKLYFNLVKIWPTGAEAWFSCGLDCNREGSSTNLSTEIVDKAESLCKTES